ncbi:hypothetical protein IAG25_32805 [Caballeronia sp. EK]|uniref:hypothetical protein n=1 Tax=Caballeronia sp. EK TaxID=2767469 RepID=UPI0016551F26|nr:hypothetical protein [Caballeronia sp. EK]MBC8641606.1 hypothetical protein [Caballeronia sp. EK]
MDANQFIKQAGKDAKIIDALHYARYALVVHDGMTVTCEGEEWQLNFRQEIGKLTAAMEALGIDTALLHAPVPPGGPSPD